jgi:hypothetical protein
MAILSSWIVIGLFVDGWAHRYAPSLDTFFNPWHATFYSGLLMMAVFTGGTMVRSIRQGSPWRRALPLGYGKTAAGLVLFGLGGVSDMIWHELYGFEGNVDAVLSPSHQVIFVGIGLSVSGPLRAAWHRPDGNSPASLVQRLPLLLSVTCLLSLLTFATMYLHPLLDIYATTHWTWVVGTFDRQTFGWMLDTLAVGGVIVQTVILMGLVLILLRRWRLPFGSLTLIFSGNALLLGFLGRHYLFIFLAFLVGLAADLLLGLLHISPGCQPWRYRLFAFSVPFLLYAGYLLCLATLMGGIAWSAHMVTGTVVLSGFIGVLVSYAVFPPRITHPSSLPSPLTPLLTPIEGARGGEAEVEGKGATQDEGR